MGKKNRLFKLTYQIEFERFEENCEGNKLVVKNLVKTKKTGSDRSDDLPKGHPAIQMITEGL